MIYRNCCKRGTGSGPLEKPAKWKRAYAASMAGTVPSNYNAIPSMTRPVSSPQWYGAATDIEDRRHAEEALKRRALDLQLIIDSISVPLAVTTPAGEVESLNQPTLDYFGMTLDTLKDWKAIDVVHPDDLERTVAAQMLAHRTATAYDVESRHRRADGVYRWYNVLGMPLRDPQGIFCAGFIC